MQQCIKEKIIADVEFIAHVLNSPQPSTARLRAQISEDVLALTVRQATK